MSVWDGTQRSKGTSFAYGAGCDTAKNLDRTCPVWTVWLADRLSPEIGAVRFDLGDGTSQIRPVEDGYVVLNVLNPLPRGGRIGANGGIAGFKPITQVTYLDPAGNPLAAERWDGLGSGRERNRVPGLPPLSDYPSLRRHIME